MGSTALIRRWAQYIVMYYGSYKRRTAIWMKDELTEEMRKVLRQ